MPKPRVLNLEPQNYSPEARRLLEDFAEVVELSPGQAPALAGFDALITRLGYRVDEKLLRGADRLKAVVTATTGLNHLDQDFLKSHGIEVLSLRGETDFLRGVTATAELTWGLLLSLTREIPAFEREARAGRWEREKFAACDLSGKTLGILGLGRLGSIVAEYARAFRMKVIACDPNLVKAPEGVALVPMNELLRESDVISVHVSYSKETQHLLGAEQLSQVKNGVFFINTSRGEIVDEKALVSAIQAGKVAKAALDVLEGEASGDEHWMKKSAAWNFAQKDSRMLITPHVGGATRDSMHKTEIFMAKKLRDFWAREGR